MRVCSILAVAGRHQFRAGQALLGVRVVAEHMPAIGAAGRAAGSMRIRGHHVAQHVHFAPAAEFAGVGGGGWVSGHVRQRGFMGVVEWDGGRVWEGVGKQLDGDVGVDLPVVHQDGQGGRRGVGRRLIRANGDFDGIERTYEWSSV